MNTTSIHIQPHPTLVQTHPTIHRRLPLRGCLLLALAWWLCEPRAGAHYAYPEIETVPTSRLTANLEKRLAGQLDEGEQYQVGEEIKIWTWNRRTLNGAYTVDTNGCIQLPEDGTLKVVERTREDLMRELNGTTDSRSKDFRGIFVEQAWHQRKGRLLPGERAELHYELARVYSIAYARNPGTSARSKAGTVRFSDSAPAATCRRTVVSSGPTARHCARPELR